MSLQGDNYAIEIRGDRATARVWKRPDIDSAAGARSAAAMVTALKELAIKRCSLVFDLREAPVVAGPRTVETLGDLLATFEASRARIAVIVTNEPMQALQYRRLLSTYAPTQGRLTTTPAEAEAWIQAPKSR